MAKSISKSSKSKTKTTKGAPSVKAAKSSATKAEQTTKKTVKPVEAKAVKPEAKAPEVKKEVKAAKVARTPRAVTTALLTKWHAISAALFAVLAVLAGAFIKSAPQDVTLGHLTSDSLKSQASTSFVPAEHVMWSVDLRWLVVAMLVFSALFSFARYRAAKAEDRGLNARILPWRWVDYAVTGALAVAIVALLSGAQGIVEIKGLALMFAAAMGFAWIAERENANAPRFVKAAYTLGALCGAFIVLSFIAYAVGTVVYGMVRYPWYTYALYAVGLAAGAAVAVLQLKAYRHVKQWTNYHVVERDYMLINLVSKAAFAIILIIGLRG